MNVSQLKIPMNPNNYSVRMSHLPHPKMPSLYRGPHLLDYANVGSAPRAYSLVDAKPSANIPKEIWKQIKDAKKIIILTRKYPNSDSMSAVLALSKTISEQFPKTKVQAFIHPVLSLAQKQIPGANKIKVSIPKIEKFDLAIAVNLGDKRMGGSNFFKDADNKIIIGNKLQSRNCRGISLINPEAPSVTSIIKNDLFDALGVEISPYTKKYIDARLAVDEAIKSGQIELHDFDSYDRIYNEYWQQHSYVNDRCKDAKGFLVEQGFQPSNSILLDSGLTLRYSVLSEKDIKDKSLSAFDQDVIDNVLKFSARRLSLNSNVGLSFQELNKSQTKVFMYSRCVDLEMFALKHGGDYHNDCKMAEFTIEKPFKYAKKEVLEFLSEHEF